MPPTYQPPDYLRVRAGEPPSFGAWKRSEQSQCQQNQLRVDAGRALPQYSPGSATPKARVKAKGNMCYTVPRPRLPDTDSSCYSDMHHERIPPISRDFAGLSIAEPDGDTPQPSKASTASDSSVLVDLKSSTCNRLIGRTFPRTRSPL